MRENSWLSYTEEDDKNVEVLAQEYKEFLSKCKTERECTQYFIKEAESHGYQDLNKLIAQGTRLKAGDKVYGVGMGKTIALFQIGKQPLTEGMNQQICYINNWVSRIFTNIYIHYSSILLCHNTVKGKRKCYPLILLNSTIIMRIHKG